MTIHPTRQKLIPPSTWPSTLPDTGSSHQADPSHQTQVHPAGHKAIHPTRPSFIPSGTWPYPTIRKFISPGTRPPIRPARDSTHQTHSHPTTPDKSSSHQTKALITKITFIRPAPLYPQLHPHSTSYTFILLETLSFPLPHVRSTSYKFTHLPTFILLLLSSIPPAYQSTTLPLPHRPPQYLSHQSTALSFPSVHHTPPPVHHTSPPMSSTHCPSYQSITLSLYLPTYHAISPTSPSYPSPYSPPLIPPTRPSQHRPTSTPHYSSHEPFTLSLPSSHQIPPPTEPSHPPLTSPPHYPSH
jgi:hypothetical protein